MIFPPRRRIPYWLVGKRNKLGASHHTAFYVPDISGMPDLFRECEGSFWLVNGL